MYLYKIERARERALFTNSVPVNTKTTLCAVLLYFLLTHISKDLVLNNNPLKIEFIYIQQATKLVKKNNILGRFIYCIKYTKFACFSILVLGLVV